MSAIAIPLILASPAGAKEQPAAPNACKPAVRSHHSIVRKTGSSSLTLDDGSEVVLAGLIIASRLDSNTEVSTWPPEHHAQTELARLAVGASAGIAPTSTTRDRYNRLTAHVFLDRAGPTIWLQAQLLRRGHARLNPQDLSPACAVALRKMETTARLAKLGLWQHAAYQIRRAERPRALLRYRNTFQIVDGVVRRVSRTNARSYINFGSNWRTDFTAGLAASLARNAEIDGIPINRLAGRTLRIRGWVRNRGGPFIAIRSLSQIELLRGRQTDSTDRHRRRATAPLINRKRNAPGR